MDYALAALVIGLIGTGVAIYSARSARSDADKVPDALQKIHDALQKIRDAIERSAR